MFDQLLAMVNLGEKLPEAVGWKYIGPYQFSIPEEVLDAIPDGQFDIDSSYTGSALVVYNYSGASKAEIRVLYSGGFNFKPKVSYGRRNVPVKWTHDADNHELIFSNTPPNETVEIELFNVDRDFSVDQVLVDGKMVTKFMNKRAIAKAYPELAFPRALLAFCVLAVTAVLTLTAYTTYGAYKQRQDNELLSAAIRGDGTCGLSVYDNPPGENNREALARKIRKLQPWMKSVVLMKNKVTSEADLYDLDRVILCNPDTADT